jgi:hypothetical protein
MQWVTVDDPETSVIPMVSAIDRALTEPSEHDEE